MVLKCSMKYKDPASMLQALKSLHYKTLVVTLFLSHIYIYITIMHYYALLQLFQIYYAKMWAILFRLKTIRKSTTAPGDLQKMKLPERCHPSALVKLTVAVLRKHTVFIDPGDSVAGNTPCLSTRMLVFLVRIIPH